MFRNANDIFINKLVFCHILMVYIFNCFWYNFEQCASLIPIEYQVEFLHVIYLNIRSVSALYTVTHTQIPQWHLVYFTVFYFGLSRSCAIIPHGFSFVLFGIILPATVLYNVLWLCCQHSGRDKIKARKNFCVY